MPSNQRSSLAAALICLAVPVVAATGQSSITVSPFVSYMPSAATNPLAGFALTFGGTTGLALRSGAEMSISNPPVDSLSRGGYRPWGADADVMLFLGGLGGGATVFSRSLSPYAFAGIGLTGGDSAGTNVVRNGWSYGLGAAIPLGLHADIFGEARWRMSEYVLPTSEGAPDSKSSMRFGLSFHVGGGSGAPIGRPARGRRHRAEIADESGDVEYVVTPAPGAPPVVVVQQEPPPAPQVVVVEQERQPDPVVVVTPERSRRYPETVITAPAEPVVVTVPEGTRPPRRVLGRSTTRVGSSPSQTSSTRAPAAQSRRVIVRGPARTQVRTQPSAQVETRPQVQVRTRPQAQAETRVVTPRARSRVPVATRGRADSARVTRTRPR